MTILNAGKYPDIIHQDHLLIKLEYMSGIRMLVHKSRIRLIENRYSKEVVYSVMLPNPSFVDKEIEIQITETLWSKLYAVLCNDLRWSTHQEFYIEGQRLN
jgi:hypothetical protein